MTRFEVIILPSAERDIGQAYKWIAERDPDAAVRWYNRLLEVIFSLDVFPERCPLARESKFLNEEIREVSTVVASTNTEFCSLCMGMKFMSCMSATGRVWRWARMNPLKNSELALCRLGKA